MNPKLLPPNLNILSGYCDSFKPSPEDRYRPLIGVSANLNENQSCINNDYTNAIIAGGGTPVVIPVTTDLAVLKNLAAQLDGLLVTGGGDINPLYSGEEPVPQLGNVSALRDQYDLMLLKLATDRQIPVFGICRGHQLINAYFGGTLYQDIYSQASGNRLKHSQTTEGSQGTHYVRIEPGSRLSNILQQENTLVNTFHHQAVKDVAAGFKSTATATDGTNEAMEACADSGKEILSVQWHPERMAVASDEQMPGLFRYFVAQARLFRECKEIHSQILTVDSHVDTPMWFTEDFSIAQRESTSKVTLPKMEEGRLDGVFMVAYLKQGDRDNASLLHATQKATDIIAQIKKQISDNRNSISLAICPEDLIRNKQEGKKTIFLGIENGYAIGKDITNVARFKNMGVSYITLSHNGDNDLCDSARGTGEHNGLSELGRQVVAEMNRLGIMIDISHTSEKTVYDVLELSKTPVIASHSSAKALCDHPRNLTDDQLKAIAKAGGVVQVCFYHGFLSSKPEATLHDAIRHIDYMVKLIGADHVGIGSDFDGDGGIRGCDAANELINITRELLRMGYTHGDLEKIWGGNLFRVMRAVQAYGEKPEDPGKSTSGKN